MGMPAGMAIRIDEIWYRRKEYMGYRTMEYGITSWNMAIELMKHGRKEYMGIEVVEHGYHQLEYGYRVMKYGYSKKEYMVLN
ncbi:hypothetical protein CEXT_301911 [Caerostris extrusa]|uniref:Uncharacterized protein n=1 Tax=Caerostris extrusa TaxID=172846 RepID=A0AAV4VVU9_CAEEX|nr:hypothetical protein CEXT_301911 [Caerostris extrusa]